MRSMCQQATPAKVTCEQTHDQRCPPPPPLAPSPATPRRPPCSKSSSTSRRSTPRRSSASGRSLSCRRCRRPRRGRSSAGSYGTARAGCLARDMCVYVWDLVCGVWGMCLAGVYSGGVPGPVMCVNMCGTWCVGCGARALLVCTGSARFSQSHRIRKSPDPLVFWTLSRKFLAIQHFVAAFKGDADISLWHETSFGRSHWPGSKNILVVGPGGPSPASLGGWP